MIENLVLEHPLVPDVDAGVSAGWSRKVGPQIEGEWPHEDKRHHHVTCQRHDVRPEV